MLPFCTIGLLLLATTRGKETCLERLGPFSVDKLCPLIIETHLSKKRPFCPERIDTQFFLYTNENPDKHELITSTDATTIEASKFQFNRMTRFIIHGFLDKGGKKWLSDMCKNMFKVEQVNCICVDWRRGSQIPSYPQAVYNTQVVGAEIALLVQVLTGMGYNPEDVHLIGHSLGAHVAAEAGKRLNGSLGRITGLDPAEPCFKDTPEEVRLDPSDAMFVDVIHTDITGLGWDRSAIEIIPEEVQLDAPDARSFLMNFGMKQKLGHLDFFPNGGVNMPGCKKWPILSFMDLNQIWEGLDDLAACNHLRSYKYYASSILNPDDFLGYPCTSYNEFKKNGCFPCPTKGCPRMGHYADQFDAKTAAVHQTFYLNTGDRNDFTSWRYKISVILSGQKQLRGQINIILHGNNEQSRPHEIFSGSLSPNARHMNIIDEDKNIGEILKVFFLWKNGPMPSRTHLGASQVTVESGDRTEYNFCSTETVPANTLQPLLPC
ncbi:PREDICTED: pancreatic lipase-related protein 2-like isoform X2 [Dipodomys ordii]|uniref:Triacylglycerol lipase n=1 Tax=Dipodomys ordii TaxID=10020 RepID=A0A1S3FB34_DIPOR|nr:PREDICTED: pancreatic lipase-related protein 2-like isoform X2 [Dipodomys ordii]